MSLLEELVEEILLRLDVEDVNRYKFVCKSWYSLISSHRFAIAHLKQHTTRNRSNPNNDLGDVRIAMPTYWKIPNERLFENNLWKVVGSSNGLVCFHSSSLGLVLVNNPWTRELRKLPLPPLQNERHVFFSFGYDSLTDDYKLLMGTSNPSTETHFQVLSLKSNTWKLIRVFKSMNFSKRPGILFDGALHWLASHSNAANIDNLNFSDSKRVILSFNLSQEEFTKIPEPGDSKYKYCRSILHSHVGILDDQLCIFFAKRNKHYDLPCDNIWVMRSCKGERFWEKLPDDYLMKYQVVHPLKKFQFTSSENNRMSFFCDDNKCLSRAWFHFKSPLFVPSLVSPYAGRPSHAKNNKTSVKSWCLKGIDDGEGQKLQASIRRCIIKDTSEKKIREIEAVYRREVGETENLYFHEEGSREIKEIVTKIEGDALCAEGVKNNEKEELSCV